MADYQQPVCECGAKLIHWDEYAYEYHTPITKAGKLNTRRTNRICAGEGAYSRLLCTSCEKEYYYSKDSEGRYIRGTRMN